jgi:hypothetical protein
MVTSGLRCRQGGKKRRFDRPPGKFFRVPVVESNR